jgi:hypothetical protein
MYMVTEGTDDHANHPCVDMYVLQYEIPLHTAAAPFPCKPTSFACTVANPVTEQTGERRRSLPFR